jgi:hypothetical protein
MEQTWRLPLEQIVMNEEVSGKAVRLLQLGAAHKRKPPAPGVSDDMFGNRFSTKELRYP